jgi:hypothetical protein
VPPEPLTETFTLFVVPLTEWTPLFVIVTAPVFADTCIAVPADTEVTAIVVKTILEKDLSKDETCLLIIQLVNALGLRDVDFKKFTETYNPNQDDSDDFEDIDGDDNEDY